MRRQMIFLVVIPLILSACEKDPIKANAEVISFNPLKCGCCWGWTINTGGKEIKTDNSNVGEIVGFEIDEPVLVYIELGKQDVNCSNYL